MAPEDLAKGQHDMVLAAIIESNIVEEGEGE